MKYFLLGGKQKGISDFFKEEWHHYGIAVVALLDTNTGDIETLFEYEGDQGYMPDEDPAILFKSGSVSKGKLYACTPTEVLVFDFKAVDSWTKPQSISHPSFNDVHHVIPYKEGILVANTGLDLVQWLDFDGNIIQEWETAPSELPRAWERFDKNLDYRKIPTTKPHQVHPNHVWVYEDEIYVTRFEQRDVLNLMTGKNYSLKEERLHDGIIDATGLGSYTSVDGKIIQLDTNTGEVSSFDMGVFNKTKNHELGWCRSLMKTEEGTYLVGFSRLRPTKFINNLRWIKNTLKGKSMVDSLPTRVWEVNPKNKKLIREFDLEKADINVIFSILPADF